MNYYEILEIPQDATTEQIKQQYKQLIKTYHPDLYKGDKTFANEKTKEITQAYKILVNPTSRNDYDMLLYDEYLENNTTYDYNYDDTHEDDLDEFNNEYKDETFFNSTTNKYKTNVYDFVNKTYDNITTKSVNYVLNSNNTIQLLIAITLILIVITFFLLQIRQIQEMYMKSQNETVINTPHVPQSILDSITIEELQEEFGTDILNQINDGTFKDLDELKTFYYLNSQN